MNRREFLTSIVRAAFRSRLTQLLFAIAVGALVAAAAYLLWLARDLVAALLAAGLILFGACLVWELLPFSEQTRIKWARREELAEKYPSYHWSSALWIGFGMLAYRLWEAWQKQQLNPWDLAVPAVFLVVGGAAMLIWRTRHRDKHQSERAEPAGVVRQFQ